jgi:hypothetical protein
MRFRSVSLIMVMAVAASLALAADTPKAESPAAAAFARLKSLAGEWQAKSAEMGDVRVSYEVVAAGSAVVERFSSDKLPAGGEMVTVYHLDGDRLLLTHYCMAQNQPRMVARGLDPATGELDFQFLDATNLARPGAVHMHRARFRFLDDNHFSSEWQFVEDGKTTATEAAQYTRIR